MEKQTLEQLKEQYAEFIAGLSDEDKAKVEACKTVEELIAFAKNSEGSLPDEIAEAVAGGEIKPSSGEECPKCHGKTIKHLNYYRKCFDCGYDW